MPVIEIHISNIGYEQIHSKMLFLIYIYIYIANMHTVLCNMNKLSLPI